MLFRGKASSRHNCILFPEVVGHHNEDNLAKLTVCKLKQKALLWQFLFLESIFSPCFQNQGFFPIKRSISLNLDLFQTAKADEDFGTGQTVQTFIPL